MAPTLAYLGYVLRTLETMKAEYEKYRQECLSGPDPTEVRALIEEMRRGKVPVTNVICFCSGSL